MRWSPGAGGLEADGAAGVGAGVGTHLVLLTRRTVDSYGGGKVHPTTTHHTPG